MVAPLGSINYWFTAEDCQVRKTVHHFLLQAAGGELCNQDHEVTEVAWIPLTDLHQRLTHPVEHGLVRRALELLAKPE